MYLIRQRQKARAGRWGEKRGGVIKLSGSFLHTQSIFVDFQHVQDGSLHALEGWIVASILRMEKKRKDTRLPSPRLFLSFASQRTTAESLFCSTATDQTPSSRQNPSLPLHSFYSGVAEPVGSGPDQYSGGSIVCLFALLHYF